MTALTVANGAGPVHIAVPDGRAFRTACWRTVRGPRVEEYPGRAADRAWRLGPRCPDCAALKGRDIRAFLKAAGF